LFLNGCVCYHFYFLFVDSKVGENGEVGNGLSTKGFYFSVKSGKSQVKIQEDDSENSKGAFMGLLRIDMFSI